MFARRVNNYFHFTIGVNNGQCFDFKNVESNISCTDPYLWRKIDMGDYDGDGRSEIIYQEYNNYWSYKSFFDDHSRLVYTIIDGMNEAISFDYKPMTDRLACIREKRNNDESICNKQIPLNLLTSMISKDKRFTFNYIDPLYHTGGLGFRGFEKVIKSDMVNNISTTTEYELGKYFYNLLPRKIITSANQSQKISEVTNEYSSKNSYKSNFFSYVAKSTNIDCLTTLETVKMYDYDNYGRPILVESKVGDNREINKFEYYQNIDLKIGNVAKVINLRIKSADQHERVYLYEYDELGNLQK